MSSEEKRVAAVMALTAALLHAPASRADDDAQALFRQVAPSVVTILVLDEQGREEGQGSGVAVGRERVATNCHVVRDARALKVRSAQGERAATWIIADPGRDLCLLAVPGLEAAPVRIRPYKALYVGERVFAVGNPLGFELSVSEGLVSALASVRGEPAIVSSAAQSPGSSGGGLFDAEGRLVGMTTSIMGIGQNLNLALPAEWIDELAVRGVPAKPPVAAPGPEPRWAEEAESLRVRGDWAALEVFARSWLAADPTSSPAGQSLGLALYNLKRKDEAERVLRDAVRNDERNASAWSYLALVLHLTDKKEEAEQALTRAAALRPGDSYVLLLRAGWLRGAGKLDEALAMIERAIAIRPADPGRWIELAEIEAARQRWDEAARAYRAALRLAPGNSQVKIALATALARAGKAGKAHELLVANDSAGAAAPWIEVGVGHLIAGRFADAESALRQAIAIEPNSYLAWFNLGAVLRRTARAQEAEEAFDRTLALKPDFARALLARSEILHKRGDLRGALGYQRLATEADPADANSWRILAGLHYEARAFSDAATAYRKLVDIGQAGAADLSLLSDCLRRIGQAEPAWEALRQAEKLAPNDTGVLLGLTAMWSQKGDQRRALDYATRAADSAPGNANAWSSKGYVLLLAGRFAEAVAALQTAVGLDPSSSNAWINLGHAHLRNREAGKAIFALQKAVSLAPGASDAHLFLAQAYLGTRQTARAREEAEAVLFRVPDLPSALAVLTLSLVLDGRKDESLAAFKRLQTKDPVAARALRAQAIAGGFSEAAALPE